MKKVRIGVVGAGYLGKYHAEKYSQMGDVELVGVVDVDGLQAAKVANSANTKAYKNYHDLIGKVEAVSIVVPTRAHFSISKDFLENDIDVLIEKPITTTLKQADELISISEKRGLIIQVGHLERFNPAVLALKDIVHNPRFIESHRLSVFKERGIDVSVVLDLMIHDIDIIASLVKSEIKNIHAAGTAVITDQVDIANTRMEFENGCVANVTASRISTKNERKTRLFQQDAYISVDFANHEISIVRKNADEINSLIPGMEIKNLCFTKGDALKDELAAFVKAVGNREDPEVTGQVGRDALKVALSIMEQIDYSQKQLIGL
ncbi:MAG: Gfo/Idh/MocA family oxidoreductase [Proteobacteria bacterium]|nr:Gfo/Idh/MocA family oxidoreductase [Pseudomonadota bacterium]